MTSPSASDLCWIIGVTPKEIVPTVCAAVRLEIEKARETAKMHLGDEQLAWEMMELAIERTAKQLASDVDINVDQTRVVLMRFYRNEVRRRRRASRKILYRGSGMDMERISSCGHHSHACIEAALDLEALLNDAPEELRRAMLLRYGSRSQWHEVAMVLSKSTEATRKLCERELKKIRRKLQI